MEISRSEQNVNSPLSIIGFLLAVLLPFLLLFPLFLLLLLVSLLLSFVLLFFQVDKFTFPSHILSQVVKSIVELRQTVGCRWADVAILARTKGGR